LPNTVDNKVDTITSNKALALNGDADAADYLGSQYRFGNTNEGVAIDYAEAFKWFQMSALKNNADAQDNLGDCYYYGYGVMTNKVEAVKWYLKSAEQGNNLGAYDLGYCYEVGDGVQQDEVEAYKWLSIAVVRGMGNARKDLTNIESDLAPEQIANAKQLATAFVPRKEEPPQ
jgi:TPR repeat protein